MRGTPAERAAAREIIDEIEADGVKCVSGPWWGGGGRLHRRYRGLLAADIAAGRETHRHPHPTGTHWRTGARTMPRSITIPGSDARIGDI